MVQLQGSQGRDVVLVVGDVTGPQGQAGAAGLRVLGLRSQMVVEQGPQGGHGERVHVASGVESHGGDVERSEVLEDVEGGLGVDLGGSDEVVHDVLVVRALVAFSWWWRFSSAIWARWASTRGSVNGIIV